LCEDADVTAENLQALDTEAFHPFVEGLDYPMFVVTTTDGTERSGCLVGFTSQVSIDPPRFLVCLSVRNHTHRIAEGATVLAVHVLAHDQRGLSELFGEETGDEVDKFSRCTWRPGPEGVPLLDGVLRLFVGRVLERVPLGDHTGYLLEPVHVEAASAAEGLTFEDVKDMEPGHDA
jgi:flavin reductase (DIM6/NTAB) family NADH-FMN oxidoreductase RutF